MKNCSSFRNGHCNVMMKPVRVGKTSTSLTPGTRFCTRQQGGGGQDTTWEWDQHWPVGQLRQDHAGLHGRAPDCQDQGSNVQEISTVAFAFSQYSPAHVKWNFIDSLSPEFCLSFTIFISTCSRWRRIIAQVSSILTVASIFQYTWLHHLTSSKKKFVTNVTCGGGLAAPLCQSVNLYQELEWNSHEFTNLNIYTCFRSCWQPRRGLNGSYSCDSIKYLVIHYKSCIIRYGSSCLWRIKWLQMFPGLCHTYVMSCAVIQY